MGAGAPQLRLKVPCRDAGEFFARLADHAAQRGLKVPTDERRPLGSPVTVALELRNGGTVTGEGVVDAHVELEGRPAVNVRMVRFERDDAAAAPAEAPLPREDEPLGQVLFGDVLEPDEELPAPSFGSSTVSGDIVAAVKRRTARVQRAAVAVAAVALLVAAGAFAASRWLVPASPEAAFAAHVEAADRLVAEGRLIGGDGAIERLVAARRLRPGDARAEERLARVAGLLEGLADRALERGDAAVAAVHLGWAQRAAPDRASIRAKLDRIEQGVPAAAPAAEAVQPAAAVAKPARRPRTRGR